MIQRRYIVYISIDEDNIHDKFNNYKFNWNDSNSLIQSIINNIPVITNIDTSIENSLDTNGIEINVHPFIKIKKNHSMSNKELDIAQNVVWELILEYQERKRSILEQLGNTTDTNPMPLKERERYLKLHDFYTILEEEKRRRSVEEKK